MKRNIILALLLGILMLLGTFGAASAEPLPVLGDTNCDGVITSADATAILRASVGMADWTEAGRHNADCTLDGAISSQDAAALLRYVVGIQAFVVPGTLSVENVTFVYDGSPRTLQVSFTNSACTPVLNMGENSATQTNAGAYPYEATLTHPDYIISGKVSGNMVIEKATYDMSGVTFTSETQNRADDSDEESIEHHTIVVKGTLPTGVTVAYYCNGQPFVDASAVGTYVITAVFTGDVQNYNAIPSMQATLTIDSGWSPGWLNVD